MLEHGAQWGLVWERLLLYGRDEHPVLAVEGDGTDFREWKLKQSVDKLPICVVLYGIYRTDTNPNGGPDAANGVC